MKNAEFSTKTMVRALGVGLAFCAAMTAAMAFSGDPAMDHVADVTQQGVTPAERLASIDHLFSDDANAPIRMIEGVTVVPGR